MPLPPGFYDKLVWLLGLNVCVSTAWSVRLTSGPVSLSDLQANFIKNTNEISLQVEND